MDPITHAPAGTTPTTEAPLIMPLDLESPTTPKGAREFTIFTVDGEFYPISSDAKSPSDLFNRLFVTEHKDAIPRTTLAVDDEPVVHYHFYEATVQLDPSILGGIRRDWPKDEDGQFFEYKEDDDGKPKRPRWSNPKK